MKKVHTLVLAFLASISLSSQSVINFTASASGTITNQAIDIFTDQNENIFLSKNNSQVFLKSTDGGATFTNVLFTGNCGTGPMVALGNKIISNDKLSLDGGATWSNHTMFSSSGIVKKFIKISETLAFACYSGFYTKTMDGGSTWSNMIFYPTTSTSGAPNAEQIFRLNNGDIIVPFGTFGHTFLISKDNLSTYSFTLTPPSIPNYSSGYIDSNGKYVLLGFNNNVGVIDGYNQNQNLASPTFTNSYLLSNSTNTVSYFGAGVQLSNGSFVVIDKSFTANGVLRTEPTSTISAINELNKLTVSAYPNPCINNITINGLDKEYNYIINNQLGQNVLQGSTSQQINTSTLMPGIYFLNIANQKVVKFIKE